LEQEGGNRRIFIWKEGKKKGAQKKRTVRPLPCVPYRKEKGDRMPQMRFGGDRRAPEKDCRPANHRPIWPGKKGSKKPSHSREEGEKNGHHEGGISARIPWSPLKEKGDKAARKTFVP